MALSIALTSLPDQASAEALSRTLLEARLAACVTALPGAQSIYWWKGALEKSSEVLLLIKFPTALRAELESQLLTAHPYDVPEFIVLDTAHCNEAYARWAKESCGSVKDTVRR